MKQVKKIPFLFALIAITLASCNLSKNVNSTASASYKKLQVAQQATVQKNNETVAQTTAPATTAPADQKATENVAVNTPVQKTVKEQQPVITRHQSFVKKALTGATTPGLKIAAAGKEHVISAHSKLRNAELTVRTALTCMGVGLLLVIIGFILAVLGAASAVTSGVSAGAVGTYIIGGVLLYIGFILLLVGLILLIIALVSQ